MRELRTAAVAVVVLTLALGLAYPLAMTGISQVLMPGRANGSVVERGGKLGRASLRTLLPQLVEEPDMVAGHRRPRSQILRRHENPVGS